jgi:hypothetical protein
VSPVLLAALLAAITATAWLATVYAPRPRGRHTRAYVTAHTTPTGPTPAERLRDRVVAVQAAVALAERRTA